MQYYILICGPNGSGKTFFGKQLLKALPKFDLVDGDDLRNFLKEQIHYYQKVDYSASKTDSVKRSAERIIRAYFEQLEEELLKNHQSIIRTATSLRASTRKYRFNIAREVNPETRTILVCFNTPSEIIEERLRDRDKDHATQFVKLYQEISKNIFDLPSDHEADHVFVHTDPGTLHDLVQKVKDVIIE